MGKRMKICLVFGLWLGLLAVSGCDHAQEAPAPETPRVVSKAISVPEPPSLPSQTAGDLPGGQASSDALKTHVNDANLKGPKQQEAAPDTAVEVSPAPVTEAQVKEEQALAETAGKDILFEMKDKYDTKGRVDPFVPLLTAREDTPPASDGENPGKPARPKRLLTPLEKMDLSQIKLVAVIKMGNQSLAMVEEAGGKGYEVRIGTYMGRNEGRVSAIQQDKLLVKEYYRDYQGKRRERIQEIKFHRNEGGE